MAKYDVHALRDGGQLVVNCQSDLVDYFDTRFVVPLVHPTGDNQPIPRLTPSFNIKGERLIMATQLAGAVPKRLLGPPIISLASHEMEIGAALDMLIGGY